MRPLIAKSLRWSLLAIVLAFAVFLLGILPFNAGFLRGPVENAVRDAIGMELSIGGPIKVRLGPWPGVTTGALRLGDVRDDPLLLVDSLRAEMSLGALLGGEVHVLELEAHGISVDYCSRLPQLPDAASDETPPPSVALDTIAITDVIVRCGPPPRADPLEISLGQVSAFAPKGAAIELTAAGSFAGMTFEITAHGGELDDLIAANNPFPVSAALSSEAAVVEATGQLLVSPPEIAIDAQVRIREADAQALARAFELELPELGALVASGRLHGDVKILKFDEFEGALGNSRFDLDTTLDMTGDRVHVEVAGTLAPLDLAPFLDAAPVAQPNSAAADDDIDFSNALHGLGVLDADFEIAVRELSGLPIDVKSVELAGRLAHGVVTLQSLTADALGGNIAVEGGLDSRAACPALQLRATMTELDLMALEPLLPLDPPLGGAVESVALKSSSCGATLLAHRDSLRADAELAGVRVSLGDEPVPLSITRLLVDTGPGRPSRLRLMGRVMSEQLEATLAAGSLEELMGEEDWPIALDVRGGGARLRLNGRAGVRGSPALNTRLAFEAPRLGTLHQWIGVAADAGLPLVASTRLRFDEARFAADALSVSLGESNLRGRVTWDHAQDPDLLVLRIRSEFVDLAEIATAFPPAAEQTASTHPNAPSDGGSTSAPFELPPVDLDLAIDAIRADRLEIQDFRISGRLRSGLIDNARISALLESEVALQGELDVDVRQLPARAKAKLAAENLDIGRVLEKLGFAEDVRLRADAFELLATSEGMSGRDMFLKSQLQVELLGFNWKIPGSSRDTGAALEDALDISLNQLKLTMAPDQPTTWSSRGSVDGMDVELWMRTPSLVETFDGVPQLPVTLVVAAGSNVVMLDARIDRSADETLAANLSLSGQVIDSESRNLSELASPLEDYELETDIVLSEGVVRLPNASMRQGSSLVTGRLDMDTRGPMTRIDLELNAPRLQTDDLLYWSVDFREALMDGAERARDEADLEADEAETLDGSGNNRGVLYLARDFLDEFREHNELNLGLTVADLNAGPDHLGEAELRLYVDADEFLLQPFTISLLGGGVDAEYTARTSNGRLDASLRINADALSYGDLLRLADPDSQARGLLFVDVAMDAETEAPPGALPFDLLFENANGTASVAAWPENIEAGVLDLWGANLIFALLPRSESGRRSRLNCVATRFDINDGVMKSNDSLLDTTDTIIRGRGTIDLARERLDLIVWPQAKREKFLSVSTPITITGTFNDFRIGVEPAGFVGTMIKWYTSLIYVPFKWLTGERFPVDGTATCFGAMGWELTPELQDYFLRRDFSAPSSPP